MASREKKLSIGRKQSSASPVPPKETVATSDTTTPPKLSFVKTEPPHQTEDASTKPTTPKVAKGTTTSTKGSTASRKRTIGKKAAALTKSLALNLKAKNKKTGKIKQRITKTLLNDAKNNLENKKTGLLRNGVKPKKVKGAKARAEAEKAAVMEEEDGPPVLEPALPLELPTEKKGGKKRARKVYSAIDENPYPKKIKAENPVRYSTVDETIDSIVHNFKDEDDQDIKEIEARKSKLICINESMEKNLVNNLSGMIENDGIKQEPGTLSESGKTEALKAKRAISKKPKTEIAKCKSLKKENIVNNLEKNITLDASAKHLIDMLDLSVRKNKRLPSSIASICSRRHSIERFSMEARENTDPLSAAVFSSMPRAVTPKSKRASRCRQSVDGRLSLRRCSPYSTRSDSSVQTLRNGKHRKTKDSVFDNLDSIVKRRKRLCSDFSGSEKSISKSGYESDSSFSDKASSHGTDTIDQKDGPLIKKEILETTNHTQPQDVTNTKSSSTISIVNILERRLSTNSLSNGIAPEEGKSELMDNNSNLCNDIKPDVSSENVDSSLLESTDTEAIHPSSKVPEKSIILDIMKQTFNDVNQEDQEKRTTRSSSKKSIKLEDDKIKSETVPTLKFYGNSSQSENDSEQTIVPEETKEDINKDISQNVNESPVIADEEPPPPTLECMEKDVSFENKTDLDLMESKETENDTEQNTSNDINISEIKTEGNVASANDASENLQTKENILEALGLQSLKAAEEAKLKGKLTKSDYTGTLKTVIKLNRFEKKKRSSTLKMTLPKTKSKVVKETKEGGSSGGGDLDLGSVDEEHKNLKEGASTSWRSHTAQSSDTAGALRKSHYSNRINNTDGSSEHTSDGDTATVDEDGGKVLVIPEKASSFSIHPDRLCKDECSHCFGKFGLFDTPCHIAQMKSVDRQDKILKTEKHLTRDSCLCDACYRHVDRKSNTPSYSNRGSKRSNIVAPGPRQNHCHVLGCDRAASSILRRKWLIKMRRSVCQVINIDLDNPGLHSIPLCEQHFNALEHLMICAMCKRRLARSHIHYVGPETNDLTKALNAEGIPVKLVDKPIVCKLCRYFATLVLKPIEERPDSDNDFFKEYRKRLLHFHNVEIMDEAAAEEPIPVPTKEKLEKEQVKKRKRVQKGANNNDPPVLEPQVDLEKNDRSRVASDRHSSSKSRSESPSDYMIDYQTLIPSIAMECGSDAEPAPKREVSTKSTTMQHIKRPRRESILKEVKLCKPMKAKTNNCDSISKNSAIAVQRLGSNPCISVRQLFPGEEDLGLQTNIEFGNVKEKAPEGWEKCISTIQYDTETKLLWQELQKPYGNQSSFLRHLILLEKYFRSGDLILSPNASHYSINYSESVQNRLHAYDNIPTNYISQIQCNPVKKSSSGIITTKDSSGPSLSIINAANIPKNTPITISQITNLAPTAVNKARNPGLPPDLISLHPGTTRPIAPALIKVAPPQKIKIPLTKNWRPNLIPIDPNKRQDKKPGYVKVISSGKPYHITLDDYNRMCAIKKSFDLKQKRLMEAQAINSNSTATTTATNTVLKSIMPRKGLTISKTATITSPKSDHSLSDGIDMESSLEKLDRTVENLESKFAETTSLMNLPKIPKSLTVIPQTVTHNLSRPATPSLMITSKPKPSTSKS